MRLGLMFQAFIGLGDDVISQNQFGKAEKRPVARADRPYENDWRRTLYLQSGECDLSFDFTECGSCKLDFMMMKSLSSGCNVPAPLQAAEAKCDFRYYKL